MRIGQKLTLSHVVMALTPVILLAGALLYVFQNSLGDLNHVATEEGVDVIVAQASEALSSEALAKLGLVHAGKCMDVERVVTQMQTDVEYVARSPRVAEIFEGLKFYHDFGGIKADGTLEVENETYKTLYADSRNFFGDFLDGKPYDELFLICAAHGHVLYSQQQNEDLGANVGEGTLKNEGLGRLWKSVNASKSTALQDYSPYSPAGGAQTAFLGSPCLDEYGEMVAVIVLEFSSGEIEKIVTDRLGLGDTGDTFLVGMDRDGQTSLRSAWPSMNKSIGEKKDGEFVTKIMAKESGSGTKERPDGKEILVSYSPVNISGLKWGMVTTQDRHEALAAVDDMLVVSETVGEKIEESREAGIQSVAVISGLMLLVFAVLSGGLAFLISRNITRPLVAAVQVADAVSAGDLSHRLVSNVQDEVGDLARSLDQMSDGLQEKAKLAMGIAQGDLTAEVVPAGPKDEFGQALHQMSEQLNEVLGGIQNAAAQVGTGSKEIADSSTNLSQGATEQAASLQEISASMTELNGQVKLNAESAGQADQLSNVARETAATGVEQMQTMTSAMDEISGSSEEIAKIIKVIDDIAFQTNLLALNAAVEAARAGQHGKGFAVVAEEVRNLAGRSAKAARETSELIEGSLSKVKNGTTIAGETATSLESIVESVTKASDLVGEIASASNEQAQGITEVSQGLTQIDSVTQQNTANSEETASAAQELSSQAATLQYLVKKFRLKGFDSAHEAAVPAPVRQEYAKPEPTPVRAAQPYRAPESGTSAAEEDLEAVIELSSDWGE
jgi:methyl-accepting chemotaxis protein